MRFCLVGSYNLADGYLGAAKALCRRGHDVSFVPAHRHFSENKNIHVDIVAREIAESNPDIVLWWRSETLNREQFRQIRDRVPVRHIMFSWDDPFCLEDAHIPPLNKAEFWDHVFTCCESSIHYYHHAGAKKTTYCPPGFDPAIHFPDYSPEHACDISLVCTNFYEDDFTPHKHVNRRKMLQYLVDRFPNRKISLYGNEHVGNQFPDLYRGWLGFEESRKVFSSSKINISTHVRPDGHKYINERVTQILGSGGLLLMDRVSGIEHLLSPYQEVVLFDPMNFDDLGVKVEKILTEEHWSEKIRLQGYGAALQKFTWDHWAEIICGELN